MLEANGIVIPMEELLLAKSKDLASYLAHPINPHATFVNAARADDGSETIVFEVRVGVSQISKYPILPEERLAVTFDPTDEQIPEVISLRGDFPSVPHLNMRVSEIPRSLCLYDVSYDALKLRWTSAGFVECVRDWLTKTSAGELHQADQPLEPLLLGAFLPLILDSDFITQVTAIGGHHKTYQVNAVGGPDRVPSAYLLEAGGPNQGDGQHRVAIFVGDPRVHGFLRETPRTLRELLLLCESEGLDLRNQLREWLRTLKDDHLSLKQQLLLLVLFPKARAVGGPIESWDTVAFFVQQDLEGIGIVLGIWNKDPNGSLGILLGNPAESGTEDTGIAILNPVFRMTKAQVARFNGTEASDMPLLMLGVGALGSMLLNQLVRKGFGTWSVLDKDSFLPHNVARHLLPHNAVGYPKAHAMHMILQGAYFGETIKTALTDDILHPRDHDQTLVELLESAKAIIDCSADVPVARYLAVDAPGDTRRLSIFLNPSGEDLVVLAEDEERSVRLDVLEMQYYGLLLETPQLENHLAQSAARIRYGRSCRDLSATISGDAIARNAAIASRALPKVLESAASSIRVWKGDADGGVILYERDVAPWFEISAGGKRIVWDERIVGWLRHLRTAKLPAETGGALIGHWDHSRNTLYLLGATKAPRDSKEEPTGFIRGAHPELRQTVEWATEVTGGSGQYVGEWHSHPDGCSTLPSEQWDRKLYPSIQEWLSLEGLPPLMLIVGMHDMRFINIEKGDGVTWKFPS